MWGHDSVRVCEWGGGVTTPFPHGVFLTTPSPAPRPQAFTSGKMNQYDRKKYVWKLVYVNMLGYDVDFG